MTELEEHDMIDSLGINHNEYDFVSKKMYAREHGFIDHLDRNKFLHETRGMCLLHKMNYLINHASAFGLDSNTYYLLGESSRCSVAFHDAIVRACMSYNVYGEHKSSRRPTYAELKETLEVIHEKMILDVESIHDLLAQGKCSQWNKKVYTSADGVDFCVFNQLKSPKQRLRAIAFVLCQQHWEIEIVEPQ